MSSKLSLITLSGSSRSHVVGSMICSRDKFSDLMISVMKHNWQCSGAVAQRGSGNFDVTECNESFPPMSTKPIKPITT